MESIIILKSMNCWRKINYKKNKTKINPIAKIKKDISYLKINDLFIYIFENYSQIIKKFWFINLLN